MGKGPRNAAKARGMGEGPSAGAGCALLQSAQSYGASQLRKAMITKLATGGKRHVRNWGCERAIAVQLTHLDGLPVHHGTAGATVAPAQHLTGGLASPLRLLGRLSLIGTPLPTTACFATRSQA